MLFLRVIRIIIASNIIREIWMAVFTVTDTAVIIFESTRDRLAALEKEKSELEISILEEQIERPLLTQEQIRFGIERYRKLNIENKEDKKRLIDNFINAIYLYDDKISFTFNYKDGTKTVLLSECDFSAVGSDTYNFGPPRET